MLLCRSALLLWMKFVTSPSALFRLLRAAPSSVRSPFSSSPTLARSLVKAFVSESCWASRVVNDCRLVMVWKSALLLSSSVPANCETDVIVEWMSLPLPLRLSAATLNRLDRAPFLFAPFGPTSWASSLRFAKT